jgi:hypothetical protein
MDHASPAELREIIRRQKRAIDELRAHVRDLGSESPEPVHVEFDVVDAYRGPANER